MRGFQIAKGYKDVTIPTRKTMKSAGYDFVAIEDLTIKPKEVVLVKTGVKAFMEDDEVLKIYPRSSLAIKKYLNLANNVGIIDADYYENEDNDGHIMIPLYNFGEEEAHILKGERVAQGIFEKFLKVTNDYNETKRSGGFGSTGSR